MGLTERHWFEGEDCSEKAEWELEDAIYARRQNNNNWIFTSEQMPELNEEACSDYVLVAIKGWKNYIHIEIAYLDMYGSSSDGHYMDTPCWIEPFGGKKHTTDEVIAWMPLPELPEVKQE